MHYKVVSATKRGGQSRAARSEKASRRATDSGEVAEKKREGWKEKILAIDGQAEFSDQRLRAVRCSNWGRELLVSTAYNTSRFRTHYDDCRSSRRRRKNANTTARTTTLKSPAFKNYFAPKLSHAAPKEPSRPLPCPGLTSMEERPSQLTCFLNIMRQSHP